MSRPAMRRLQALAHALRAKVDERVPVTRAELGVLLERLRHETGPSERAPGDGAPPTPRWRSRLDRELHDEILDELLRGRRRRPR